MGRNISPGIFPGKIPGIPHDLAGKERALVSAQEEEPWNEHY